jgi:hypothetical protein
MKKNAARLVSRAFVLAALLAGCGAEFGPDDSHDFASPAGASGGGVPCPTPKPARKSAGPDGTTPANGTTAEPARAQDACPPDRRPSGGHSLDVQPAAEVAPDATPELPAAWSELRAWLSQPSRSTKTRGDAGETLAQP